MPNQFLMDNTKEQSGVALIEVLVAILLLTIGLLAMAGLTVSAGAYNNASKIKGVATLLVNDYAERARSNLVGFDRGGYSYKNQQGFQYTPPGTASVPSSSASGEVAADGVAAYDRDDWLIQVSRRLPKGRAYVEVEAPSVGGTGPRAMNVWLNWQEQESSLAILNKGPATCPAGVSAVAGSKCLYFRVAI